MANSLIELYGGGMARKSNNYQLGGRIARSRRGREYQGEIRGLEKKQKKAAKAKRKAGLLGSIGSFVGGTLGSALGPWGTAAGAGIGRALGESTYAKSDFGGGKYAQQTREDLTEGERDYRKGIGERALVTAAQAAIMPGIYEKAGKAAASAGEFVKGIPTALEAAEDMEGLSRMQALGDYAKSFSPSTDIGGTLSGALGSAVDPKARAAEIVGSWGGDVGQTPTLYAGSRPDVTFSPQEFKLDMYGDMALENFGETSLGDFSGANLPSPYSADAYRTLGGYGPFLSGRGGGWIPKMQAGGLGGVSLKGGGLIDYTIPKMQYGGRAGTEYDPTRPQQQQTNPYGQQIFGSNNPVFGPGTDWSMTGSNVFGFQGAGAQVSNPKAAAPTGPIGRGINVGYGTATDIEGALSQMGMGDIASDPRLQKYLTDLPQFGMGYAQQVGDIYAGGKQATRAIRGGARTAAGQRGFGRSGIGSQQLESTMTGLYTDIDRQRRGVVEGYQADLLSAIGDIERKGEFEFGGGWSDADASKASSLVKDALSTIQSKLPATGQSTIESDPMQDWYDQQYG